MVRSEESVQSEKCKVQRRTDWWLCGVSRSYDRTVGASSHSTGDLPFFHFALLTSHLALFSRHGALRPGT